MDLGEFGKSFYLGGSKMPCAFQPKGYPYSATMFPSRAVRGNVRRLRQGHLRVSTSPALLKCLLSHVVGSTTFQHRRLSMYRLTAEAHHVPDDQTKA